MHNDFLGDMADALDNAQREVNQASGGSIPTEAPDMAFANERIDQLTLLCAAMWEVMKDKLAVPDEELVNKVAELDARDGVADGKLTATPRKCTACARPIFPKHRKCLYCGAAVVIDNVFKTI
jgi:rRNA maturation endonuclease Nob1